MTTETRPRLSAARREPARAPSPGSGPTVAELLRPLLKSMFGEQLPMRFEFWDGSGVGPDTPAGRIVLRSENALRRLVWAPGELGIARAFVVGDLELEGADGEGAEVFTALRSLHDAMANRLPRASDILVPLLTAARRFHLYGPPPPPPRTEVRLSGWLGGRSVHSRQRDEDAVRHHYDIGNDFYRLLLGPAMTYSCARFVEDGFTLEQAQAAKHELVCRKLGLDEAVSASDDAARASRRLLDVGCGWGSMAIHAASNYRVDVVGVTLSPEQATLARKTVADCGLAGRVDIRIEDYRDLRGETFDAISSIGMFEHVGEKRMAGYFSTLYGLLRPQGRLLNHAISSVGGSKIRGRTFMNRYVFPDGELLDVGDVVLGMERAGFEVRDVESLREHYALTLRHWLANLEENWDEAVALVGEERARVWRLYMSASVNGFEDGGIAIHQVLGVRPDSSGGSGMARTRAAWG